MSPWASLLILVLLSTNAAGSRIAYAATPPATVDLKCKIVSGVGEPRRSLWLVELRNAAGEPLRRTLRMVGDTVRFKNLLPGIYRIYLWGRGGRRGTISVDLVPAPGESYAEFEKVVRVPEAAAPTPGQYRVSLRTLEIPKEASAEMHAAEKSILNGEEAEMVRHLLRAIDLYPEYADAWNNLGAYHYRNGEFEQAVQNFSKVTELKPESHLGWMNLGASLLATGRFAEAVEADKKALALDPDNAITNSQLGFGYYYLSNYTDAKRYLKRALDLDPAMVEAPQRMLAQIAIRENSYAEAMAYLRGYLRYHPNSADAGEVKRMLAELGGGTADGHDRSRK